MRWYWILLVLTLFALAAAPAEAVASVKHLTASTAAVVPIMLFGLAVLSLFAALVLSSRGFALLALVFGLGVLTMQQGYLHAWARFASTATGDGLPLGIDLAQLVPGVTTVIPHEAAWLLPLALCAMLLAGALLIGPKAE